MYSDNDAAAAGVSFSLSGGWSRRDTASGHVGDKPSGFAGDGGAHDVNWQPRLRNTAVALNTSSLWFPVRFGAETDAEWEACAARSEMSLAARENSGAHVSEPEQDAGMRNAEGIADAGLDWHFTHHTLWSQLCI
jgi:hypothetical protein